MNEKFHKRVAMNEDADPRGKINGSYLKGSPKHEHGHPYEFDQEKYYHPIPIAKDLTDQIASSKPRDNMQSLLKIPPSLFANFVKMAQEWMKVHGNHENLERFMQP